MAEWAEWVWLNGRLARGAEASVSVFDRSFLLGDGVFETMRARGCRVFRAPEHLARLREGLELFGLSPQPLIDDHELHSILHELLDANQLRDAAIRLTVSRGVGAAGPDPTNVGPATMVIAARPYTGPASRGIDHGVTAIISQVVKNERSPLCRVKSTSYAEHVLARLEATRHRAPEALLLNTKGQLAEASSSNLFAVIDGRLCTPDLDSGCLPGITRAATLKIANEAGIEVYEGPLLPETIEDWQEAFLTNSLVGVAPLFRVAGQPIGVERASGKPTPLGPITRMLKQKYEEMAAGDGADGASD